MTANAANLIAFPEREQALVYLRNRQNSDGSWRGYWWYDPEFTTALAAKALSKTGKPEDCAHIEAAIEWAMQRLGSDGVVKTSLYPSGSTFATALALQIINFEPGRQRVQTYVRKSVGWLLSKQTTAGFWRSAATLRLPYPYDTKPDDYKNWRTNGKGDLGEIISDTRKIYTTAIVLDTFLDIESSSAEFGDEL